MKPYRHHDAPGCTVLLLALLILIVLGLRLLVALRCLHDGFPWYLCWR